MNYEEDIKIDIDWLDRELVNQPHLMFQYSKNAAEMENNRSKAKENLDIVMAEVDTDIRNNPEDHDIIKVTEASVKAAILKTAKYKKANQAYIDAVYEYNIAVAAVKSIEQKKSSIEGLVKLVLANYFASPSVPHQTKEIIENSSDKILNQKVAESMRRKRTT
jgi:hypothetical protein